jgi:hypothetical protein
MDYFFVFKVMPFTFHENINTNVISTNLNN